MTNWMVKNLEKNGCTSIVPNGFIEVVNWMAENSNIECPAHLEETYQDENDEIRCTCCGRIKRKD